MLHTFGITAHKIDCKLDDSQEKEKEREWEIERVKNKTKQSLWQEEMANRLPRDRGEQNEHRWIKQVECVFSFVFLYVFMYDVLCDVISIEKKLFSSSTARYFFLILNFEVETRIHCPRFSKKRMIWNGNSEAKNKEPKLNNECAIKMGECVKK